jgi:hemerythrin-like domain-containing protein
MEQAVPPAPGASPVQDFSQCHAGIVGQLHALEELPALLEPAARARRIAEDTIRFFREVVYQHHEEEEKDLFPAVVASATKGPEREKVERIVAALTAEHRSVEAEWERLEPRLKAVAKGHDADLPPGAVEGLVQTYLAHARYEEEEFLPLSQQILGRDRNHLAALGVALHLRHSVPRMIDRFAGRI